MRVPLLAETIGNGATVVSRNDGQVNTLESAWRACQFYRPDTFTALDVQAVLNADGLAISLGAVCVLLDQLETAGLVTSEDGKHYQ